MLNLAGARAFVVQHGVVLSAAAGPVPTLTHAIAGERIRGSWWGHRQGKRIFNIFNELYEDPDLVVCKLGRGKVTVIHRRLWPALACLADFLGPERTARIIQEHTPSGRHRNVTTPFEQWCPAEVRAEGADLSVDDARAALGEWVDLG